jgi:hypothetical protein
MTRSIWICLPADRSRAICSHRPSPRENWLRHTVVVDNPPALGCHPCFTLHGA